MLPKVLLLEYPVRIRMTNNGFDDQSHYEDDSDYCEAEFSLAEEYPDGSAVYVYDDYMVTRYPDNTLSPIEPI